MSNTIILLSKSHYVKYDEIYAWCVTQFGPSLSKTSITTETSIRWYSTVTFSQPEFIFLDEKDAMLFTLRWL
jgi:hypothetical protein